MVTKPNKQQVRDWMMQRQAERTPPPAQERIREQLGWRLTQPYAGPTSR